MDAVDETCTSISQDALVAREGSVDFQDNAPGESAQEEGEVIGYFELDPSAGLQLMQGENTIYLPPEALGEHVLMSEGGKGCQQIIVVVEEGAEGGVTGLASGSSSGAPFNEGCGSTFVEDAFDVQQQLSPDAQVELKPGHQQVLVLRDQDGTIGGAPEDTTSIVDGSNPHNVSADQGILICSEGGPGHPDEVIKLDSAMGNGTDTDGKTLEPPTLEDIKEHVTAKDVRENLLVDESLCKARSETANLISDSDRELLCGPPELDLPCSDRVKLPGAPLMTKETADGKAPAALSGMACMLNNALSGLPSENMPDDFKCDATDASLKVLHDEGQFMNVSAENSAEDCQDGSMYLTAAAPDDASCHGKEGSIIDPSYNQRECQQSQGSIPERTQQKGDGDGNRSSVISAGYLSHQEGSAAKNAFEPQRDCFDATAAEPDLNTSATYTAEENLLSAFSYTSTTSPSVQSVQPFCMKDADSFPASVPGRDSKDTKTVSGDIAEAEEHMASSKTFNGPNVSCELEAKENRSAAVHDEDLGSREMTMHLQQDDVPEAGKECQNVPSIEQRSEQIDDSLHETELAVGSRTLQHTCNTLRDLAKEVIDKQPALSALKHIEESSSVRSVKILPTGNDTSCGISPAGKEELFSRRATKEASPERELANFVALNSSTESLTYSNSTRHVRDVSDYPHTKTAASEVNIRESGILQSEGKCGDDLLHGENDFPASMAHGATNVNPSDAACSDETDAANVPPSGTENDDEQKEDMSLSESGLFLNGSDESLNMSQDKHECLMNKLETESVVKIDNVQVSCRDEESGDVEGERHSLLTEHSEAAQSDCMTDETQSVERKDLERQPASSVVGRTVGEELMAALELVPCQESSPPPILGGTEGAGHQEPEKKLVEGITETPPKVQRKRKKKSEAPLVNPEDPSTCQKRWSLRTPTKPRKRVIIPDSDEDDFDSYESFEVSQPVQKSKAEEAFDALLNVFKIEQAKKAAEKATGKDTRKAGSDLAKQRRAARSGRDRKDRIKQTTTPENNTPIISSKASTSNVEAPPSTSAAPKPVRSEKAPHRKPPVPKKDPVTSRKYLPFGNASFGDIRIRCQRPTSSPDKSAPQYHCSKCGFRSARMDNIVRHHKEECPHTKAYLKWNHDILK